MLAKFQPHKAVAFDIHPVENGLQVLRKTFLVGHVASLPLTILHLWQFSDLSIALNHEGLLPHPDVRFCFGLSGSYKPASLAGWCQPGVLFGLVRPVSFMPAFRREP